VHLQHPQPAVGVPVDGDGVDDQRLGRGDVDRQPVRQLERLERVGWRKGRRELVQRLLRPERHRQQLVDGADDVVLDGRRELARPAVVDHRPLGLVPALGQDPAGRDVARDVVRVRRHPQPARVELVLQPDRIIDDHLAGQEDHGQVVAERPGLHAVR
jgi:hypothetical protein